MKVVHLTDSPFFGGPERQILGLSVNLGSRVETSVLCFRDGASCVPFVRQLANAGIDARMLDRGNPHFIGIIAEIARELRARRADVLICHGYKADLLGWVAARFVGVSVISVSRGWTSHTRKVRFNEALDRWILHHMDRVVCVSDGQAAKVRRAGVHADRIRVIRNAIDASRFDPDAAGARAKLQGLFPSPPGLIVIGVGRLSPEKGFDLLVDAARILALRDSTTGFLIVGEGPDRAKLEERVREAKLVGRFVFAGFRSDVDALLPGADLLAQSSHTEGLPNVILEACAAAIPVVATDVGGTREVVRDGVNGFLVQSGDAGILAARLGELLSAPAQRRTMGIQGRERVRGEFSFERQSADYVTLLTDLVGRRNSGAARSVSVMSHRAASEGA
jgi:glycosyltransferase involved in cell wall biosynthesis